MVTTLQLRGLVVTREFRPLDLTVPAGGTTALVARADLATAVARVVVGLAAPLAGRIQVGRGDVTDLPPGQRHLGYVPAGGALLPHLTVRENIRYGQRRQLVDKLAGDRLDAIIAAFALTTVAQQRPDPLSPAQRFRAALARAAASLPEALVVDQPEVLGAAAELATLIPRVTPAEAPPLPVLVCTTDPAALAGTPVLVPVEPLPPVGRLEPVEPAETTGPGGSPETGGSPGTRR